MTDGQAVAEQPIMLRADITRAELKALKTIAVLEDKTVQALVGEVLRERIAKAAA